MKIKYTNTISRHRCGKLYQFVRASFSSNCSSTIFCLPCRFVVLVDFQENNVNELPGFTTPLIRVFSTGDIIRALFSKSKELAAVDTTLTSFASHRSTFLRLFFLLIFWHCAKQKYSLAFVGFSVIVRVTSVANGEFNYSTAINRERL